MHVPRGRGDRILTRRRFLLGTGGLAGAGALGAVLGTRSSRPVNVPHVALGAQPAGLPVRQHAWTQTLSLDRHGNSVPPRFDRLVFFEVLGRPTPSYALLLEASLRELERSYSWGPDGLLFTASWGTHYFKHVLGVRSPIPEATALSDFEAPSIDRYDLCLHVACDDAERLGVVERQLASRLHPVLRHRDTRTGFTGAGLPAAHQRVGGIPVGDPVNRAAPLFMGFKSALKHNQASENSVTIQGGGLDQGTTMAVSYMRLRLDSWYRDLGYAERVARMYSPQTSPEDAARITTDAESHPKLLGQAIRRYGVIGHAQAAACARVHGRPRILRRDFDTVDGGLAGLHFVSLQRRIEDFVTTRTAMNQEGAQLINPGISATVNNGINEFIFVVRRGNYLMPSRADRAFPLLPERGQLL